MSVSEVRKNNMYQEGQCTPYGQVSNEGWVCEGFVLKIVLNVSLEFLYFFLTLFLAG